MSAEESAESRQNNEFEALKAIYGDDLKDLRGKSAWNKWSPLNFTISLNPQQGSVGYTGIYVKVDLHIICSRSYPKSLPKIKLENSKGLSDNSLIQLQADLEKYSKQLEGEEMIFQLAQHVQEFLHSHNKPTPKSFYDEMLQRQKQEEESVLRAQLIENDKRKQMMQQEFQRIQEMLKSETRLKREHRYNSENSDNDVDNRRLSISNNSFENSDDCLLEEHKKTVIIEFGNRDIKRGQCLRHCSFNHVVFIGMDVETGEVVLLSEWIIKNSKCIASLEQEFHYLAKLRHQNLVHYLGFKSEHLSDDTAVVYILKEYVNGPNCSYFLNDNFDVSIQFLRFVSKGVLLALDYLHRNNVVHKDIRESCVYVNEKGAVMISNYSLHRRLTDISSQSSIFPNYNKKTDIYKFGVLLVTLLQGSSLSSHAEDVDIPTSVPSDFHDFLTRCLATHDKERLSAAQLLKHSFICQFNNLSSPRHHFEQIISTRNASPELTPSDLAALRQSGQSRIEQEFEFIAFLGKGAFGDVIKARNRLDGRCYAVKRIKLNPRNRQLNKKIVREVKLLSSLNHENIVRYYNSWIEKVTSKKDESSDSENTTSPINEPRPRIQILDEFTLRDNIEEMAPPSKNVEVSITYDSKSQAAFNADSDDSSSDDGNSWGVFQADSDSDGIEFAKGTNSDSLLQPSGQSTKNTNSKDSALEGETQMECMYIQMELCEKSTLRNAIDNGMNKQRARRLFREIIEGLAHIHQQGMIHRDLKPVNIFLDAGDHVKIGDFGLATNIKTKLNEYNYFNRSFPDKDDTMDESKTGLIGTALYVAPELCVASKANYNQKVDIYSLGIIYFEMCYKPLSTNMERIKILTGLREKGIAIPDDFNDPADKLLIKWLLNHDISKRPTSQELLQSEHLPSPLVEECKFRSLVKTTLGNPQSKLYKYLIAECFDQTFNLAEDITYDKDPLALFFNKPQVSDFVKDVITKIFKRHGGQNLSTPLLMPKSQYYAGVDSSVKLMTHFGGIVSLPHDLRVPFARYVAWNGITLMRRYSIDRVYREKKVFGLIPRELYECAFDIVTPNPANYLPDAEILYVMYEIINELPGLKNKQVTIRLNHTSLMMAILLYYGIKERHQEVLQKFSDFKEGKVSRSDLETYLIGFSLSDNSILMLTSTFSLEFEVYKVPAQLQNITRKKAMEASRLAKQALQDLKSIVQCAEAFGVTFDTVIAPGVVHNTRQYSGMICQFVCEPKKKHRHGNKEVLAAGGRYDSMVASYRKIIQDANPSAREIAQSAVGISLSLDKLVQAMMREQPEDMPKMEIVDVAVCSVGCKPLLKEKTKILRNLWTAGICSTFVDGANIEEIQEQCTELKIPHIVMLKDSDQGMVRVRSKERDRFQEKTFKEPELLENLQKIIKYWKEGAQEVVPFAGTTSKSENKNSYGEKGEQSSEVTVSVIFVIDDKLSATARRRYETQIRSHLDGLFKRLIGYVTVLGLSLEANVIRTIASHIEWDSELQFNKSVEIITERHQRHKAQLSEICDKIYEEKCKKTKPAVVLFNISDCFHRLLI